MSQEALFPEEFLVSESVFCPKGGTRHAVAQGGGANYARGWARCCKCGLVWKRPGALDADRPRWAT